MDTVRRTKNILLPLFLVVATLYLARDFFMPLALAILLSFVLAPIVRKFEHWHFGRIGAVITVTLLTFSFLGGLGAIVGGQLIDIAQKLPGYQTELHRKIMAVKAPGHGVFANATKTLQDLSKDISKPEEPAATDAKTGAPAAAVTPANKPRTRPADLADRVQKVEVVNTAKGALETITEFVTPILAPIGTAAIVIVFVIFMLLGREDLRDRIIHLIGRGHLQTTTQALDEAAHRVSKYLLAQLVVNACYGLPIGVGLAFIGVPNGILWGLLATLLRFIPYIGAWIASAFPMALSLAVAPGWWMPAVTLGLFVVVELVTANVIEPYLYGHSTGIAPMAVIIAAAFWTWLWGTTGLLLATPLTVCIAVMGKYLPALSFLDVLLGDRPPIADEDRFYQRLLAKDEDEVLDIAEQHLAKHTLGQTYDELIIRAIRLADEDFNRDVLSDELRAQMLEQVNGIVADLGEVRTPAASSPSAAANQSTPPGTLPETDLAAVIIPACDYADELAGLMLCKLLATAGAACKLIPSKLLTGEMIEEVSKLSTRQFCISVTPPGATRRALYTYKRLRERFPDARILIGVWGEPAGDNVRLSRFRTIASDGVYTTLQEMSRNLLATATTVAPTPIAGTTSSSAESKKAD